jgi:peptide/nickel transport system ATP-binding protein
MVDTTVLRVKNLQTKLQIAGHPVTVVDDLSFDLQRGRTLALVGESGCGKSMAALSLMRLLPHPPALPSEGQVWYRDMDLLSLSEREMSKLRGVRLAMIFQDPSNALNPVYTIGDQLAEVVQIHLHRYGAAARALVIEALRDVGIARPEERYYDYPHQLSGGMRQRVMIAMALVCRPDVLIADEPTTALDVTIQAQILELIRSRQKQDGTAVLLITHDMGVVAESADDVIVMYAGQCIERGTIEDIFNKSAHPYTQALFSARPTLQPSSGALYTIKGHVPSLGHYPEGCRFHPRCPYAMPCCYHGEVPEFHIRGTKGQKAHCWLHANEEERQQHLQNFF